MPISIEELDVLQFGRVLHARPRGMEVNAPSLGTPNKIKSESHDLECAMAAYGLLEERALARGDKKEAKALRSEMKRLVYQVVMGGPKPSSPDR